IPGMGGIPGQGRGQGIDGNPWDNSGFGQGYPGAGLGGAGGYPGAGGFGGGYPGAGGFGQGNAGAGGFGGGYPGAGLGGAGGYPGMGGLGQGMDADFMQALQDPEFMAGLSDPQKLVANPKYAKLMQKISEQAQNSDYNRMGPNPAGRGGMPKTTSKAAQKKK
ncbi:MAG: hypothetical protein EZS28_041889, partial [Streblomastix strix]